MDAFKIEEFIKVVFLADKLTIVLLTVDKLLMDEFNEDKLIIEAIFNVLLTADKLLMDAFFTHKLLIDKLLIDALYKVVIFVLFPINTFEELGPTKKVDAVSIIKLLIQFYYIKNI